jgi:hypothetical protein
LAQQPNIPKAQLEEMFADILATTPWDMKGDMLWGYFFTSTNKNDLEEIGAKLVSDGYHLVEIRNLESDAPEEVPEWQLHVERVETQTIDTLFATNNRFQHLASLYEYVIYDGMDVGPAD